MIDKWVVRDDSGQVVVVKRDDRNQTVVVGGHRKFRTMMERIVEDCIGRDVPENQHSQRGRIRLVVTGVRVEQWNHATKRMCEEWTAERVERHGRLL